ncbi:hypothetical protein KRR40_44365 [Niabella defluvii]|nr:hypothetical protein KRR40_44365 [Niabella sp. I65]
MKLLQPIIEDGCRIITSEFRLSYYSGTKQYQVRNMIEQGLVELVDQSDDLALFIEEFSEAFGYAGKGVLALMHLCRSMQCTLIIEDDEQLILDIAAYFGVSTISITDFYKQKIKDIKYYEFLINAQKK